MPFTPSHAVIALGFVRTPLMPAAIAVGAMTPDLPLFVRGTPLSYGVTHDLAWLPMTAVVALALLLVWRMVLRPAARELSPRWLAARLPTGWDAAASAGARETVSRPGRPAPSWTGATVLAASIVIGVASHIAWDLFTHEGRWGVTALPVLGQAWGPLNGYTWLQHGSSIVGLAILAAWAARRLARTDPAPPARPLLPSPVRWAWWLSLPAVLGAAWIAGFAALGPFTADLTAPQLGYRVLPPACAAWGAVTVAICILVQVRRSARQVQDAGQAGSSRPQGRGASKAPGPPS